MDETTPEQSPDQPTLRRRIYALVAEPIRTHTGRDWYDMVALLAIVVSLLPLMFREPPQVFRTTELLVTAFFAVDYLLRWACADLRSGRTGRKAFLLYPFTPAAIIDACAILPGIAFMTGHYRVLAAARLLQLFRLSRVFRAVRYSESVSVVIGALKRQRSALLTVVIVTLLYIFVCALFLFNLEPETFGNFPEALYWSAITTTSVGYGDIAPVTPIGRLITAITSVVAVGVVALPASIITAGFMEELAVRREYEAKRAEEKADKPDVFDLVDLFSLEEAFGAMVRWDSAEKAAANLAEALDTEAETDGEDTEAEASGEGAGPEGDREGEDDAAGTTADERP